MTRPAKNTISAMSSSTLLLDLIIAFQVACASAAPRTASVTSRGMPPAAAARNGRDRASPRREPWRRRPTADFHRIGGMRLADEALGLLRAEHAALKLQAALRILGQLIVVLRARSAEIALGVDVQPDRAENRLGEVRPQERQRHVLVQVVDAAQRGVSPRSFSRWPMSCSSAAHTSAGAAPACSARCALCSACSSCVMPSPSYSRPPFASYKPMICSITKGSSRSSRW